MMYTTIICINQNTGHRDKKYGTGNKKHGAPRRRPLRIYPLLSCVGDGDLDVPCVVIILRPVYNHFSASCVVILQISRCFTHIRCFIDTSFRNNWRIRRIQSSLSIPDAPDTSQWFRQCPVQMYSAAPSPAAW